MFNLIRKRDVLPTVDRFFTQYIERIVLHATEGSKQYTREPFLSGAIRSSTEAVDGLESSVF